MPPTPSTKSANSAQTPVKALAEIYSITEVKSIAGSTFKTGSLVVVKFYALGSTPGTLQDALWGFYLPTAQPGAFQVGQPVIAAWQSPRYTYGYPDLNLNPTVAHSWQVVDDLGGGGGVPYTTTLRSLENAGDLLNEALTRKAADEARVAHNGDQISQEQLQKVLDALPPIITDLNKVKDPLHGAWISVPCPTLESELYEQGELPVGYLRIGYVSFITDSPLEDIQVARDMPLETVTTLRSRSPIQKNNWMSNTRVTLSLTFNDIHALNQVLLPLVRLSRKAPFLPVVNQLLNDVGIEALAIASIQVGTVPGHPNTLKLLLTCWDFNWKAFFPSAVNLDSLFSYPLLKLWVEQDLGRKAEVIPVHTPFGAQWDGVFNLYHLRADQLEKAAILAKQIDPTTGLTPADARRVTKDAMNRAAAWDKSGPDPGQLGNFQAYPDLVGFFKDNSSRAFNNVPNTWTLGDDFGRVLLKVGSVGGATIAPGTYSPNTQDYMVLKLRDVEIAKLAARYAKDGNDKIRIFRGTFSIVRLPNSLNEPHPGNHEISAADFQTQLQGATRVETEREILQGFYKFLIPRGSPFLYTHTTEFESTALPPVNDISEAAIEPDYTKPFNPGNSQMIVEQITCSAENLLAPLPTRGFESVTFQYMGSTAIYYQISGKMSRAAIANCSEFLNRVHGLARQHPGKSDGSPFGGFVHIQNELAHFMSTKNVLPLGLDYSTIPGFPDECQFTLTLVEFDNTQRSREALNDLMSGFTQETLAGGSLGSIYDNQDITYTRWKGFHQRLSRTELYPDLMLPTHSEITRWLEDAKQGRIWDWTARGGAGAPLKGYEFLDPGRGGSGWQWSSDGAIRKQGEQVIAIPLTDDFLRQPIPIKADRFADPDFYCGPSQIFGTALVDAVANNSAVTGVTVRDQWGEEVPIKPGDYVPDVVEQGGYKGTGITFQQGKRWADEGKQGGGVRPFGTAPRLPNIFGIPTSGLPNTSSIFSGTFNDPSKLPPGEVQGPDVRPPSASELPGYLTEHQLGILNRDYPGGAPDRLRLQPWFEQVDRMWRRWGISTFAWMHNVLRESGGNPDARNGNQAFGLYQFDRGGVFARLRTIFTEEESMKIAMGPISSTNWLLEIEKRAVKRVSLEKDPYKQTYLFTKYIERPARVHVNAVEAKVAPFVGKTDINQNLPPAPPPVARGRGTTTNKRGTTTVPNQTSAPPVGGGNISPPINDAKFKEQVEATAQMLLRRFRAGEAFRRDDLIPYSVSPAKTAEQNKYAWIQEGWLEAVEGVSVSTGAGSPAQTATKTYLPYFKVKTTRLREFAAQWLLHGQKPALAKVVGDQVGNTNTFTGDSVAEDIAADQRATGDPLKALYNPDTWEDAFHDMRRSLITGRLVGAFPTFYTAIVDGGRALRIWRLFDHVYGLSAVTDISVHRHRQDPVETAVVGFSNMYGMWTAQAASLQRMKENDPRGTWSLAAVQTAFNNWIGVDDETVQAWARQLRNVMLRPGCRLHIRLGYGSDAQELPIVFNGVITEVPVTEGQIRVVALSDGIELMNPAPPNAAVGSTPVYRQSGWYHTGVNPRELIMNFLDPNRNAAIQAAVSKTLGQVTPLAYYDNLNRNAYGIEHFGKSVHGALISWEGESGVNVYNPIEVVPKAASTPWENALGILNLMGWGNQEKMIGIQLQNGTVWDVVETCRKAVPDYIAYAVPTELRSTLFYGKGWFPLYGNYRDEIDTLYQTIADNDHPQMYFHRKPFQQIHMISSAYNLLQNEVKADSTMVKTKCQAIGTYNGWVPGSRDMGAEQSTVMHVDTDIYDEHQKMLVVDSPLYTTIQMKTTTPGQWLMNRSVVDHYAAASLRDTVKEMYQGPLVITGNGWIKPYDIQVVSDKISGLNGMCETRSVVHTLSLGTGFISEVTPDCMISYMDYEGQSYKLWAWQYVSQILQTMEMAVLVGLVNRAASTYGVRTVIRQTLSSIRSELKRPSKDNPFFGMPRVELEGLERELSDEFSQAQKFLGRDRQGVKFWSASDASKQNLYRIVADLVEPSNRPAWSDVFKKLPKTIRLKSEIAHGLSQGGKKLGEFTRDPQLATRHQNLLDDLGARASAAQRQLDAARSAFESLGTEADRKVVTEAVRRGEDLSKITGLQGNATAQEIATSLQQFNKAQGGFTRASAAVRAAGAGRTAVQTALLELEGAAAFLRTAAGGTVAAGLVFAALYIAEGSISEWVYRQFHARQCFVIYPLRVWGQELTAGIEGHRGAVAGDLQGDLDRLLTNMAGWVNGSTLGVSNGLILSLIPFVGATAEGMARATSKYQTPALPLVDPLTPGPGVI